MTRLLTFAMFGGLAAAGIGIGNSIEGLHVSMPTMATVGGTVFGAGFWLSGHLTRITDKLASIEERLDGLPCQEKHSKCHQDVIEPLS